MSLWSTAFSAGKTNINVVALFVHSRPCVWGFCVCAHCFFFHTKRSLQGKVDDDHDECGKYGWRCIKWGAYLFLVPTFILFVAVAPSVQLKNVCDL